MKSKNINVIERIFQNKYFLACCDGWGTFIFCGVFLRSTLSCFFFRRKKSQSRLGNSGKYLGLCWENFFLNPPPKNSSNCVFKTILSSTGTSLLGGSDDSSFFFSGGGIKKREELWDPSRLYFIKKWLNVAHHTVAVAGPFFSVLESLSLSIMTL